MTYIPRFSLILLLVPATVAFAKAKRAKTRAPATINAQILPDFRARALIRKSAPFVVEESTEGEAVRINKDGTFTRAVGSNAYQPDGKWKVSNNQVKLRWNTGQERAYSVAFSKGAPVIAGRRANKQGTFAVGDLK